MSLSGQNLSYRLLDRTQHIHHSSMLRPQHVEEHSSLSQPALGLQRCFLTDTILYVRFASTSSQYEKTDSQGCLRTSAYACEPGIEALSGIATLVEGNEAYRQTMLHFSVDPTYQIGREEIDNLSDMFAKLEVASGRSTHNYIYSATVSYPSKARRQQYRQRDHEQCFRRHAS